jgi:alcohol dehydrogenase class IV
VNARLIVTDATLAKLGIAARIEAALHKAGIETRVFAEVEPEPSLQTTQRGAQVAIDFAPDWIVGLGGGSPMDASKAIWAIYEHPELDPTDINPMVTIGLSKAKLIAIPTTSGTGSEATWALVLTDTTEMRKFSTGSRELVPTLAMVDPTLTQALPPRVTADTGLDALTHAIEGYVCTWRNDFSDGLCLKARSWSSTIWSARWPTATTWKRASTWATPPRSPGWALATPTWGWRTRWVTASAHSSSSRTAAPWRSICPTPSTTLSTVDWAATATSRVFCGFTDSRDEEEAARLLAAKVRELAQAVGQPMSIAAFGIEPRRLPRAAAQAGGVRRAGHAVLHRAAHPRIRGTGADVRVRLRRQTN